uniref:Amino acid transporter transmembrane domain-containing protein n=1 Tax=Noctiluca scintillans TaxID=2966 RepID=A0A7S1AB03_NOCSC|mmetsp:Transcript_38922/g.103452  ORF Transcript_38922/g.103452 Transcript_38922/m.103452 type:complete len:495 (+) Transcript_38922:144-1628(+)
MTVHASSDVEEVQLQKSWEDEDGEDNNHNRRGGRGTSSFSFTVGGLRHSALTLVSTAVGSGVLTVSYMMSLVGVGLGVLMLATGALLAYLSIVSLMQMSTQTGQHSYAALLAHCAGPRAGPFLDTLLMLFGFGSCVGYLVFVGDFVPDLIMSVAGTCPEYVRTIAIVGAAVIVTPLSCQRSLDALRCITPLGIISLIFTSVVVAAMMPGLFSKHNHTLDYGKLEWFTVNTSIFECFAMCIFAFNCHLNVVPVASGFVRPTRRRIVRVSGSVNMLQVLFYWFIAVTGYMTFLNETPQDILKGYTQTSVWLVISRVLLSLTMLVCLPMNIHPSVSSGLQLIAYARSPNEPEWEVSSPSSPDPSSPNLASPNSASPNQLTPNRPDELDTELVARRSRVTATTLAPDVGMLPRTVFSVVLVILATLTAIAVPGVADVIQILGATVATAMMLVVPAFCMRKVMPRTLGNTLQIVVFLSFACCSIASVPIKFLRSGGIIS